MYRANPLKQKLRDAKKVLGCWLHLESTIAAEMLALSGFDFLVIDHEHGPGSIMSAINTMQAMNGTDCVPLVRVPWNDTVYLKRILDAGAEAIMVPSVETAEEAEAVVKACHYPPKGVRGAGYPLVRASSYGLDGERYRDDNGKELLIICQVETVKAVENIDALLAVEGVDMWFIGPMDLSASVGKLGDLEDPEFKAYKRKAEEAIVASDKLLGGLPWAADPADAMFARGYDLAVGASDVIMLRESALEHLKTFRPNQNTDRSSY